MSNLLFDKAVERTSIPPRLYQSALLSGTNPIERYLYAKGKSLVQANRYQLGILFIQSRTGTQIKKQICAPDADFPYPFRYLTNNFIASARQESIKEEYTRPYSFFKAVLNSPTELK